MSSALSPIGGACSQPLGLTNGGFTYHCGEIQGDAYLTPIDVINFALPTRTVFDIGTDILWRHCIAVSSEFRGYARKRYRMPLRAWGASVVEKLAFRAAGSALRQRGFAEDQNPQIKAMYEEAKGWMEEVRDYKIDIDVIESQPIVNTPRASSLPLRGWEVI